MGESFQVWFYRALMMLVVSCPCALVISTPVSIVSAIGNAAKNGVLIKGGAHLERLGAVSVVAFDKTGTLTAGIPQVTEIVPLNSRSEEEVLLVAAAVESASEHPVAQAIVRKAKQANIPLKPISMFTSVTGRGAQANIEGTLYYIGSPRWFIELNVSLENIKDSIQRLEKQGQTVMILGTGHEVWAIFAVADEIRASSKSALEHLKAIGIEKTVMLTGDNRGTAEAVAAKLGGIEYRSELLPEDKVSSVKELMKQHGYVAMIGDGINDAPALATATVGIAMGAAGTDTALETADVALMADDLSKLPFAIRLSRQALRIIKQNIAFSLLVKVVFLIMIFLGTSTLWMAVLADTGSSLIVIANGMRLLRTRAGSTRA
jgi:Cd2+/Zn2+-exporting ATPase